MKTQLLECICLLLLLLLCAIITCTLASGIIRSHTEMLGGAEMQDCKLGGAETQDCNLGGTKIQDSKLGSSKFANKFPQFVCKMSRRIPGSIDYSLLESAGEVTTYSSLMPWHVPSVQKALRTEFHNTSPIIVDATAHIGADSANFLKIFPGAKITAIEIDNEIAKITKRNLERIAIVTGSAPPTVISTDGLAYIDALSQVPDFVYIDPPWGGSNYKSADKRRMRLELSGVHLPAVICTTLKKAHAVVVKLPRETDLKWFESEVATDCETKYSVTEHAICDERRGNCAQYPSYWLLFFKNID